MSTDPERDAGIRYFAVHTASWVVAVVLVALLDWPRAAVIAVFAVLFGVGLVLLQRRRRNG